MSGSFLPSLWSSTNHSLLGSQEPALLCNHVVLLRFHLSGYGVISNDAGRFKRFYSYFFCPRAHLPHGTRIASPWLPCFTCVTPTRSGRFASSIRCGPPNISSVTIDHDELCDLPLGRRVA